MIAVTVAAQVVTRLVGGAAEAVGLEGGLLTELARVGIPLVAATVVVMLLYRFVPARRLGVGDAVVGGVVTGLLLLAISAASAFVYDKVAGLSAVYGSITALLVFLYSVYLYASALLFGAELAAAWSAPPGHGAGRADPATGSGRRPRPVRPAHAAPRRTSPARRGVTRRLTAPPTVREDRRASPVGRRTTGRRRPPAPGGARLAAQVDTDALSSRVASMMPQLREELAQLVAIPSVSAAGYPAEPRPRCSTRTSFVVGLLRDAGVEVLEPLELPNTAPVIMGEIPAPPGAPTVLLYGHYDVVPAGDESKWESPPFEATERDGAIYGRGAADSKSNILVHVGALRAWGGKPPVGIKLVIEGQEEIGSALTTYPPSQPELFAADAMVIADMGSLRPGVPTLTVGLRGMAGVIVQVENACRPEAQRASSAAPLPMRCSCCCTRSRRCTTRTATSPCPACGARSGPAPRTATTSSATWPRSCRACRSSGPAASASGSGPGRRSPSPASTLSPSTRRSMPSSRTRAPSSAFGSIRSRTPQRRRRR